MTDEPVRDLRVARALDDVPVPDYEAGFWDRLEDRIGAGGAVPAPEAPGLAEHHVDLPAVAPLARRRGLVERPRRLVIVAAAAAVVLAVVAISLRPGGGTAVRTAAAPGRSVHGPGAALGTSAAVTVPANADASSPQAAFAAWVEAVHARDTAKALALTGPRTARYEDALKVSDADRVAGWDSAWGDWADRGAAAHGRIDVVDLGTASGQRVVGIVLRRPASGARYVDQYDALPMVLGDDGWKVEPDAFDPSTEGRLEVVSPMPGQDGLQDLPSTGAVTVAATGTGDYVLSVDLSHSMTVPVTQAVGGTITWDPPDAALAPGAHLLLVAHVSATTIALEADPFTVAR